MGTGAAEDAARLVARIDSDDDRRAAIQDLAMLAANVTSIARPQSK